MEINNLISENKINEALNHCLKNNLNNLGSLIQKVSGITTEEPIILKNVNGNTSPLGNVLTNNYGLFLQSYAPTCNLSKTYGIIANSKGERYTLTKNYSIIPTIRNFNIYDV